MWPAGSSLELLLEAEEERFQRQLLGDVEVEPAARVLDQLGRAAGGSGVEPLGTGAQLREPVAVEDDLLGAGGDRGEVAAPDGAELEAEVEHVGTAAAAGPFRLVGDLAGRAFDAGLLFLLERLAGRRLGIGADLLGGRQQCAPWSRGAGSADALAG